VNQYGRTHTPFFLIVDFELECPKVYTLDELALKQIEVSFPTYKNHVSHSNTIPARIELQKYPQSLEAYSEGYDVVQQNLHYGNSFLTNFTSSTPIDLNIDLDSLFQVAKATYKIKYKQDWVCFSPEIFIQIREGKIFSFPMKGTIDASIPDAEHHILNDLKESAEHYTIVDLIRNDLALVASHIQVSRFRYIDTLHTSSKTLLQVSSEIQGVLPIDYMQYLGDIIFRLLPAGSISGAPKAKTLEIIQKAEQAKRGFYTGAAFYFDGKNLDSCVLIRFVEQTDKGLVYKSGGGITINSDVALEYQELIDKIYVPGI
jgi:para-aminobenzoate synthetase component 1